MSGVLTIGILSALWGVELPALKLAFDITDGDLDPANDDHPIWKRLLEVENRAPITIYVSCLSETGNVAASLQTRSFISRCNPDLIFFVGIACGVRRYCLSDVVVSEGIWGYEHAKVTGEGKLDRSRLLVPPSSLLDVFRTFDGKDAWRASYLTKLARADVAQRPRHIIQDPDYEGPAIIASGEKVIADGALATFNRQHDLIRAGETEGYGFAKACTQSRHPMPWLVVRGISDYGDAEKDRLESSSSTSALTTPGSVSISRQHFAELGSPAVKDEFHFAAALSAATFLRVVIGNAAVRLIGQRNERTLRKTVQPEAVSSTEILNAITLDIDEWEFSGNLDSFSVRFRFWRLLQGILNLVRAHYEMKDDYFVGCNLMFVRENKLNGKWRSRLSPADLFFDNEKLVLTMVLAMTTRYFVTNSEYKNYYIFLKRDREEHGIKKRLGFVGRSVRDLFWRPLSNPELHFPTLDDIISHTGDFEPINSGNGDVEAKFGYGIKFSGHYDGIYASRANEGFVRGLSRREEESIKSIVNIPIFGSAQGGESSKCAGHT